MPEPYYPIASKPPQTLEDITEYLRSWLDPVLGGEKNPIVFRNDNWIETHGFRRGFCIHGALKNQRTGEYCFDVNEYGWGESSPIMGIYADWDSMILGVSRRYADRWRISY